MQNIHDIIRNGVHTGERWVKIPMLASWKGVSSRYLICCVASHTNTTPEIFQPNNTVMDVNKYSQLFMLSLLFGSRSTFFQILVVYRQIIGLRHRVCIQLCWHPETQRRRLLELK